MLLQRFRLAEGQFMRRIQGLENLKHCPSICRCQKSSFSAGMAQGLQERHEGWSWSHQGGNSFSRNESTAKAYLQAWGIFSLRNALGGFSLALCPGLTFPQGLNPPMGKPCSCLKRALPGLGAWHSWSRMGLGMGPGSGLGSGISG